MHASTGHFGLAAMEVLHWLAKDATNHTVCDTGHAHGLAKLAQALSIAEQLNAQSPTGTPACCRHAVQQRPPPPICFHFHPAVP
eukprot:5681228-Amphidinium_carterae.1